MKAYIKSICLASGMLLASAALQSCSLDEPFGNQGEGVLQMRLSIDSDVTRAELNEQELADRCVVYISGQKGLVRKYIGLSNLPEQEVLTRGHYVAEAWTGDSVPASFDSKFYRGYQPFDVAAGLNQVQLNCKIMNAVVSVDKAKLDAANIQDFNIKVESSNASLDFTADNYEAAKGYFMLPYGSDGVRESVLKVTVSGKNLAGEAFSKEKLIEGVQSAHEYVIGITTEPVGEDGPVGGSYIKITIDDRENIINDTVAIFAAPEIAGEGFDIEKQVIGQPGAFPEEKMVKITAFYEIKSFTMQCVDMENLNLPAHKIDLKMCTDDVKNRLNTAGITWDKTVTDVNGYDGVKRQVSYLHFSQAYLNALPERETEYRIILTATDGSGKTSEQTLRIAVGDAAVVYDDPVIVGDAVDPNNLMSVGSRSVSLDVELTASDVQNAGVRYRPASAGDDAWVTVPVASTRGSMKYTLRLTDLAPSTRYEYQAVADGFTSESKFFTTESVFVIPNASMEEWSTYEASTMLGKKIVNLPALDRNNGFWESGNEGAATVNKVLTSKFEDMKHSGTYGVKLQSMSAVGVLAAGNIFTGKYVKTDGSNGILEFGRPYDGSHPSKVRVWANYRPGSGVSITSGNENLVGDLEKGGTDQGQIFVALTTGTVEIRTNPKNRKLFDPNGEEVVAYGEVTWKDAFGADGVLEKLEIPFTYNAKAKYTRPTHLVIVCAASKYGDYFSGAEGSTMYLDDFELVYE